MPKLFDEFDAVSAKAWKQKIQADLKGADYNETLVWNSPEGIAVKPFYHSEDLDQKSPSNYTHCSQFKIGKTIIVEEAKRSNTLAKSAIKDGIDSLHFIVTSETTDVNDIIKDINLSEIDTHFTFEFLSSKYVKAIAQLPYAKDLNLHIDILGHLSASGNWYKNLQNDHEELERIISFSNTFKSVIHVNTNLYQNAGATMVQQLAYGLAQANEYLNHFGDKLAQPISFNVAIGSNYFFEIAKLRALRLLWKTLAAEYKVSMTCRILATPSKRNKTIYDYNTNMLRTTTECMSAILGGADVIYNMPYDALYHKENDFGTRIAKNQLLILKHECYFDAVNNPSDGSYYIENLTDDLAQKALDLFKDIENNGGFLKQLKDGTIQRKIKESAAKEEERFIAGNEILLGTNMHPNPNDKMKDELEVYPFLKTNKRKTLIEPIIPKRLAEKTEIERLKTE
ncbi:MAG: methylmalonyl-CoA mutase [Flavobacteriaceae bacterium]|nr:MAG: methylmalonyl-CoA mutase [Flavobacteriaceae bacterium]